MQEDTKTVAQLMMELLDAVNRLIRQELQLARVEAGEKTSQAIASLISIVGGMLVALASLLVLVQAVVVALADHMPDEMAALIVGVSLAVVAFLLIRIGQSNLKAQNLALPKTQKSLQQDKELVMETVR